MWKNCFPHGGYESPALGLWALAVCGHGVVVLLLSFIFLDGGIPDEDSISSSVYFVNRSMFIGLTAAHCLCVLVVGVFSILSYLTSSCFLSLLFALSIPAQCILFTTCGICGSMLTVATSYKSEVIEAVRHLQVIPPPSAYHIFLMGHETKLLIICILCLAAFIPYTRGASLSSAAPAYDAIVYTNALLWILTTAALFIFIRPTPELTGFSGAWLVFGVGLQVAIVTRKMCCIQVLAIGLSIWFLVGSSFAIVSVARVAAFYVRGKEANFLVASFHDIATPFKKIEELSDSQFADLKIYSLTQSGTYLLLGTALSIATFTFLIYAALSALRSVCSCHNPTNSVEDKSEHP